MILRRWLLGVVGLRVLAAIAAMTAVLQLLDLFEVSTRIIDRGQGVAGVATYAALHAPHLVEQAAPFGVLAGALFAFGKLARENAVVALRAAGLSIYRFTALASPAVLGVAGGLLALSLWIAPHSDGALADWWRATTPVAEREAREPQTFRLGGDMVVASPGDEAGRRLVQVSLYHRDANGRLVRRIRADAAVLGPGGWRLLGVSTEAYGASEVVRRTTPSLAWTRRLTAADVRALFSRDPTLSPGGARRALTGGAASRPPAFYQTALMRLWAGPAGALVLLLIAAPSAMGAVRDGSGVRLTLTCLAAGLLFMVADGVLTSLGSSNVLAPALAAWGAPVLFSGGALAALLHLEGEGAKETYVPGRIAIVPVDSRPLLERFIRLPMRLNAGDPNYVAPLLMERREALSPATNPFFEHADVRFWLATLDGRDVGRISAQVDRLAQAREGDASRTGAFGLLAAEDDPAIFAALAETAEAWLREQGCTRALGPLNLSINEEVGLLVEGFDTPPMVMMGHDPPYAGPRLEALGYAKAKDVYAYLCRNTDDLPAAVLKRIRRGAPEGVRLRPLDMSRFDAEVATLTSILNDAWSQNWGFVPTTEAETRALAKALKLVVDPRLTWFAEIDGEPAGVIVYLPNLNEAIRDLGGKLLPFGWAKLLWRLKVRRVKSARVPLMGVARRFQGERRGQLLPFLLIDRGGREAFRLGYTSFELSWVLEDNRAMRRIAEAIGARVYKTYRIYEKPLA
ncbi:MAG: LptF/LptG family permease [Caulobacteraceae bacterium]|nr:LptF/LptG family permease [Caulobacter sp.]